MLTEDEKLSLSIQIRELGLNSGTILRSGGQLYITGKQPEVKPPVINLPHWSDGKNSAVIIEGQR